MIVYHVFEDVNVWDEKKKNGNAIISYGTRGEKYP